MIEIILYTLLLYFLQLFLPVTLKSKMTPEMFQRSRRATENLKESLPIFFACAVLSIVIGVDSFVYALSWIIFRIAYVFCYVYKLNPYRSIVWMGSIVCLVLMAINLIK